jgi:hypothetical protein
MTRITSIWFELTFDEPDYFYMVWIGYQGTIHLQIKQNLLKQNKAYTKNNKGITL